MRKRGSDANVSPLDVGSYFGSHFRTSRSALQRYADAAHEITQGLPEAAGHGARRVLSGAPDTPVVKGPPVLHNSVARNGR
jgi:hypothetical protein